MRKFLTIAFAALTLAIVAPVASKASTPAQSGIAAEGVVAPASTKSTAGSFDNCTCYRYTYRVRYHRVRYVPVRYTYRYRYTYRVTYRW